MSTISPYHSVEIFISKCHSKPFSNQGPFLDSFLTLNVNILGLKVKVWWVQSIL